MLAFPSISLFWCFSYDKFAPVFVTIHSTPASGALRESLHGASFSETLGTRFSLDDEEYCIGWERSANRFHFADAVGT